MCGCVSPREQEDVEIQSKEVQLQIFTCTIDDIRNGFFFLNEGESISQQHLLSGFQNMQNMILALITKYTGADEPDGSYEFRNILISFYLNSREKSSDKAKAIVQLLYKEKQELTRYEIRQIFQRIFRSVISYSQALVDKYLVPKPKPIEEQKEENQDQDLQQQLKEEKKNELDDEKQQEIENQQKNNNEQIEQKKEEKQKNDEQLEQKNQEVNNEVKNISFDQLEREKEARKRARKLKKKIIEKVLSQQVEEYLKYGKKIANKITKKFLSSPEETMTVDEFAEKCETLIPEKFGRDIMWPRGVRLLTFEFYDKSSVKR